MLNRKKRYKVYYLHDTQLRLNIIHLGSEYFVDWTYEWTNKQTDKMEWLLDNSQNMEIKGYE